MAKSRLISPHDPLPAGWQEPFDLWRESKFADISTAMRHILEHSQHDLALLPTQPLNPQPFEAVAKAWRQQMFEATIWRLLATLPATQVVSLKVNPDVFQSGNFKEALTMVTKDNLTREVTVLFNKTTDGLKKALSGHRDFRRHAMEHRKSPRHVYKPSERTYLLDQPREQLLLALAPDCGGEDFLRHMEAYLLRETLNEVLPAATAPVATRRLRL